jgi:hypothetical protein
LDPRINDDYFSGRCGDAKCGMAEPRQFIASRVKHE